MLIVSLTACRKEDQPQVVLYCSVDDHVAREVIAAFEKKTGVRVLLVGDTEAKKTTALVDRLVSEKDNPQADVFWSSEIFYTIDLAEQGVLDEHLSNATVDWPNEWRDRQRRWFAFAGRARVIAYAPQRVPPKAVPRTWMDLTDERFRGRIVIADPRFGTTGGHLGAMKAYWDREIAPGFYAAFLEGLADNEVRLLPSGNAGVVAAVASGEADVGMTDTDDVWAAQANGKDVRLIYPAHNSDAGETGIGTLLIPNTVARVRGGPNPQPATRLIDFLLSEQVERMLHESVSHNLPLGPNRAGPGSEFVVPDPLAIDYALAARVRPGALEQAMNVLTRREKPASIPASRPADDDEPSKLDATVEEPGDAR